MVLREIDRRPQPEQIEIAHPAIYVVETFRLYNVNFRDCQYYTVFNLDQLNLPYLKNGLVILNFEGLDFHCPPKPHTGSEALYFIDTYKGNDRILVSILPPWSKTSNHTHREPINERYFIEYGTLDIEDRSFKAKSSHIVRPGERHQVRTEDQPAILIINMKNARLVPEHQQHDPIPKDNYLLNTL